MIVQKIDNQQYLNQPAFKQVVWKSEWNRFASSELSEHVKNFSPEFETLGRDFDIIVRAHCGRPKRSFSNGVRIIVMDAVKGPFKQLRRFFSQSKICILSNCDSVDMDLSKIIDDKNPDSILIRLKAAIGSLHPEKSAKL